MKNITAAMFPDRDHARKAIIDLRDAGVPDAAISIIGREEDGVATDDAIPTTGTAATDAAITDASTEDRFVDRDGDERLTTEGENHTLRGVIGGGTLGALLGVVALAIPGVGPFVAAGAVAAGAIPAAMGTGILLGAGAGGLREVLTQHGVSDETESAYYETGLNAGSLFVSVDRDATRHSDSEIERILMENGGTRSSSGAVAAATA